MSEQSPSSPSLAEVLALLGGQQQSKAAANTTQVLGGTGKDDSIILRIGFTSYFSDPKRVVYRSGRPSTIYSELALGPVAEAIMTFGGLDPSKVEYWCGKDNILRVSNRQGAAGGSAEIITLK